MADREPAAEIDDAAVAWATRAERGLSRAEHAELDRWLEGDPRRLGAFVRAQAAWAHAERAVALGILPEDSAADEDRLDAPPAPRRLSRRMVVGGGSALAASLATAAVVGWPRSRTLESGVGEIRRLALADGTTLVLDTDTQVDVAEGSGERTLALRRGRVFLDVLRDDARALVLDAAGLALEMAEGSFSVQAVAGLPLVALVTKGQLAVSQSIGLLRGQRRVALHENQALSLAAGAALGADAIRPLAPSARAQLLAWRDGMVSFGGETLATAVRAFDRYGAIRIVVADPALAAQKVTGLFRADDPRGFAMVAAASFGGVVSTQGNLVRINPK